MKRFLIFFTGLILWIGVMTGVISLLHAIVFGKSGILALSYERNPTFAIIASVIVILSSGVGTYNMVMLIGPWWTFTRDRFPKQQKH